MISVYILYIYVRLVFKGFVNMYIENVLFFYMIKVIILLDIYCFDVIRDYVWIDCKVKLII